MANESATIVIKKKKGGGHAAAHGGAWKVAYADFVTAMMCFFLVMWLMGSDEETKAAISHYFNHPNTPYHDGKDPMSQVARPLGEKEGQGDSVVLGGEGFWPEDLVPRPTPVRDVMKEYATISKLIQDLLDGRVYGVEATAEYVKFSLPEQVLFKAGTNDLSQGARNDLDTLADLLKHFSGFIVIEGHTDDVQPKKEYANNWELSMARSLSVLDYLSKAHHIPESRLIPVARGSMRPLAPGRDPASRTRNRRVEFILSYERPL